MRSLFLATIISLTACGPPVAQGLWLVDKTASHDCLSDDQGQLVCQPPEGLDKTEQRGLLRVDRLASGRLRLIDLQGDSVIGKAYVDGALFRWYQKTRQADCEEILDIELSLKIDADDKLTGFRRESNTRGDSCTQPGLHDLGFLLKGVRDAAEAP